MTHEEQIIHVVQKTIPAVVSIVVSEDLALLEAKGFPLLGELPPWYAEEEELLERLPRTEDGKIKIGGGSGFIVDPGGYILTNKHVVADPDADYTIFTPDEEHHRARVLARDPINDVAILKVDAEGLPVISLGNSDKILLGQSVVAVGNALGEFKNTVSTGIVSGLSRFITAITDLEGHAERLRGLIQTDAAINPGNSGGPLLDFRGEAIGINSAIVFGAQNIGFAIPINKAKHDLEDVKRYGRLKKPFLGVRYVTLTKELQRRLHAPADHGAFVIAEVGEGHAVARGSAAERAGIREHDVILAVNSEPITERHSLEDVLDQRAIGDALTLTVLRSGQEQDVAVTLDERR